MIKIMVVDDEYVSRSKLGFILKKYGIVHEFDNGADAVVAFEKALLEKASYSLVTLDISMPNMGGLKVLNKIRLIESTLITLEENKAKIIMVTAHNDIDSVRIALSQKCNACLVKPIEQKDLMDKLIKIGFIQP